MEFYSFVEKFDPKTRDRIPLEMTKPQKVIMEKLLNSTEPLYLDENALMPIIMEECVFVESEGHHPAKSVLINHLKENQVEAGTLQYISVHLKDIMTILKLELFKKISEKILIFVEVIRNYELEKTL